MQITPRNYELFYEVGPDRPTLLLRPDLTMRQPACSMESSINYGMERVWSIGVCRGTNAVSVGYDEGVVLMKMGSEEPVASMDATGRIIYARHNDVHTAVIKALGTDYEIVDGERLPLPVKVHALCTWRAVYLDAAHRSG